MTLKFCDQHGNVQQDASQEPSGVVTTPNLLTGSAEFSTGGYPFCYVRLTKIPDYSWCGVAITKLNLSDGERLWIQSGISGDFEEMTQATHENRYYIPTLNEPLTAKQFNNEIAFQFRPASDEVGHKSRSNIELLYQGKCHCNKGTVLSMPGQSIAYMQATYFIVKSLALKPRGITLNNQYSMLKLFPLKFF